MPADQREWLEAQVLTESLAAGRFASIDEALVVAVADLMVIQADDLAWARPYVDEALTSVARGKVSSGDDFFNRLDAKPATLRSRCTDTATSPAGY